MDALRKSIQDREAKAGVQPIRAEEPAAETVQAEPAAKPAAKSRRKKAS
jgi:hypothetical protein